jgi:hypothetical protein
MQHNPKFDPDFADPTEWARMYRDAGLQVVPAMTPSENRTQWKRPALPKWRALEHELAPDLTFERWYGEQGEHARRNNMGMITGQCSGNVFMIDLDLHKNPAAATWWDGLLALHNMGGDIETPRQTTGGGGKQILFRAPAGWTPPTCKTSIGVDIRGQGGFAMLPPSMHESGTPYKWDAGLEPWDMVIMEAPRWLCDEIVDLAKTHGGGSTTSAGPAERTQTPEMAKNEFGRIIDGREEYMTRMVWGRVVDEYRQCPIKPSKADEDDILRMLFTKYEIATKSRIVERGTPNHILLEREGRGISLLRQKLKHALDQWDDKVRRHAEAPPPGCRSFETLELDPDGDAAPIEDFEQEPASDADPGPQTSEHQDTGTGSKSAGSNGSDARGQMFFPKHLVHPPGSVGEIANTILRSANRYLSPQTAIGAALAVLGHASQNKFVVGARRTPLGLYVMVVAQTGAGKGDCIGTAMELFRGTAAEAGLHGAHASGAALHRALANLQTGEKSPCSLTIVDEIGLKLQQRSNAGDVHTGPLVTTLMELFGKDNSSIPAKTYADAKRNIGCLHNPLVTILGFTTSDPLNKALTSADAASGFANRFLLIEAEGVEMRLRPDDEVKRDVPPSIPALIKALDGIKGKTEPRIIELDEAAKTIMEAFKNEADDACLKGDIFSALWTRAYQNALAVAAILVIGDCASLTQEFGPKILAKHAQYATDFVRWSVISWIRRFGDEVADGPQEAERIKVLNLIRNARSRKSKDAIENRMLKHGFMPHSLLLRLSKMSASTLNGHIQTLLDAEQIEVTVVEVKGHRSFKCYRIGHTPS